ncbi:uncharacterized protein METZ01_LOCUS436619, partial [marine metagenome]
KADENERAKLRVHDLRVHDSVLA